MTNNHDSVPDPSQWFEKFDPKYFFDAPRPVQRNNELWLVLAEQEVEFLEEVFWKVIVYLRGHGRSSSSMFDSKDRWTREAHLVIPPLSGADIVSEVATHTSGPTYPNKTIVRRLIPKRKEKDSEMSERVEYFEHADGESAGLSSCCCRIRDGSISHFPVCVLSSKVNRVVYVPILGSASDPADPAASLPFYYPKVIQFYVKSFGYSYVDGGSKATIGQVDSQDESEDRFGKRIMKPQLFIYFLLPPHSPPQSHHSIIQLEILPFTSTNSFLPTDKMVHCHLLLTVSLYTVYAFALPPRFQFAFLLTPAHDPILSLTALRPDTTFPQVVQMVRRRGDIHVDLREDEGQVRGEVEAGPRKPTPGNSSLKILRLRVFWCRFGSRSITKTVPKGEITLLHPDFNPTSSLTHGIVFNRPSSLRRKLNFVDLGCGNGLLTHILTCEGYNGVGIDLARRRIWDLFEGEGVGTRLVAETLHPPTVRYPDADWLIGNHADELVPWIPIIAARSSPVCKFVVIPCCFHSLTGAKYRFGSTVGQGKYRAYVDHVRDLSVRCGFEVEEENLRIPSTKNVSIVGRTRRHVGEEIEEEIGRIVGEAGTFVPRVSDRVREEMRRGDGGGGCERGGECI
ncbi:hypothetical protein BC936DRAFT_138340 [Jimgerdemannia flammicorona]|uniref:tRNA (uracil-O(2)-)-methyltransferase n=1 Tax=Jimgerdemannia flammicorona TaxID=994334 RepID=A0A433CM12_9FUNG|nr:hypothetical protein BC936DRAFT_138340 [Jimgerdemannia flammicorona]